MITDAEKKELTNQQLISKAEEYHELEFM